MRNIIIVLFSLIILGFLVFQFWPQIIGRGPVLVTYKLSGKVKMVNDCSQNGVGDLPANIRIDTDLHYVQSTPPDPALNPDKIVKSFAAAATGPATREAVYNFSSGLTNKPGKNWKVNSIRGANDAICAPIIQDCNTPTNYCVNTSANAFEVIVTRQSPTATKDFQFLCNCSRNPN